MEPFKFPIYRLYPDVSKMDRAIIISDLEKNYDKCVNSHKIKNRWENQFLDIQFIPKVETIFTGAANFINKNKLGSVIVPHSGMGFFTDEFWFNIMKPGDSTGWHDHKEKACMSGVFYLKVPENSGNLIFRVKKNQKWLYLNEEPDEGKMVLFPSNLEHAAEVNSSNEVRISIAFNLYKLPLELKKDRQDYSMAKFYS
tara:strand:+ start:747 stop:1340 length:594 start_codon:yes stop_codon:yes gene_type:complete